MTSSSATRLPNPSENFPISLSKEFKYTDSNLKELIEEVASFTSKVYATFPALDIKGRNQLREVGFSFHPFPEVPSAGECEQFEEALKKEIITVLNEKKEHIIIKLSTDYSPQDTLAKVAESVFKTINQLGFLFPYKTNTEIKLDAEKNKLHLDMRFKC